ncbi:hypothetical protein NBRC116592_11770 [Colwellia sp. KU-HH00111]|uniref:hypothetical protein n=1 Tax=Colwellia sp. KU-HH00111 TaxID=3127652 RepID=UPI0031024434
MNLLPRKFELVDFEVNELHIIVKLISNSSDGTNFELEHSDIVDLLNMMLKKFESTQSNILGVYHEGKL